MSSDRLPNAASAHIPFAKLADYALSPTNEKGQHKARVFRSALGLDQTDAEWLRQRIAAAVLEAEARKQPPSGYGDRYVVDFGLTTDVGTAGVRTTWIVRNGEAFPRLTSCYVL